MTKNEYQQKYCIMKRTRIRLHQTARLFLIAGLILLQQLIYCNENDSVFGKYTGAADYFKKAGWNTILMNGEEWKTNKSLVVTNYSSKKDQGKYAVNYYLVFKDKNIQPDKNPDGEISFNVDIYSTDKTNIVQPYRGGSYEIFLPSGVFKFDTVGKAQNIIKNLRLLRNQNGKRDTIPGRLLNIEHAEIKIINRNQRHTTRIILYFLFNNGEYLFAKLNPTVLPQTKEDFSYAWKNIARALSGLFVLFGIFRWIARRARGEDKAEADMRLPLLNERSWKLYFSKTPTTYFNISEEYDLVEKISFVIDNLKRTENLLLEIQAVKLPNLRCIEFHNIARESKSRTPWFPPFRHELFMAQNIEEVSFSQVSPDFVNAYFSRVYYTASLKKINISNCGIHEIPNQIFSLKNLEVLIINDEKNLKEIPDEIYQLTTLKELIFSKILNLETTISDEISVLKNLEVLKLHHLKIDEISSALYKLPKLRTVDFSNSSFTPTEDYEIFQRKYKSG